MPKVEEMLKAEEKVTIFVPLNQLFPEAHKKINDE